MDVVRGSRLLVLNDRRGSRREHLGALATAAIYDYERAGTVDDDASRRDIISQYLTDSEYNVVQTTL